MGADGALSHHERSERNVPVPQEVERIQPLQLASSISPYPPDSLRVSNHSTDPFPLERIGVERRRGGVRGRAPKNEEWSRPTRLLASLRPARDVLVVLLGRGVRLLGHLVGESIGPLSARSQGEGVERVFPPSRPQNLPTGQNKTQLELQSRHE